MTSQWLKGYGSGGNFVFLMKEGKRNVLIVAGGGGKNIFSKQLHQASLDTKGGCCGKYKQSEDGFTFFICWDLINWNFC